MRIFDEKNNEITKPDLSLGRLVPDRILKEHHAAVEYVPEQGHFETIREYPNGGKDVAWVVDVPGVEAAEAWDEYESIWRYVPYTEEELAQMNQPTVEQRVSELEEAIEMLLAGVTE